MVGRLNWNAHICSSGAEAGHLLAERLVVLAEEATRRSGRFTLAVSGGRTPEGLYSELGSAYARRLPWASTDVYFADERAVPPTDVRSNYGLVERTLLAPLRSAGLRVHRIEGEREPVQDAADRYDAELRATLGGPPVGAPAGPTFDAILLGIGSDGHTASLFPGSTTLRETARWTVVEPSPHLDPHVPRISLTLPVIRASRHALFLVTGPEKQSIVQQDFGDPARGTLDAVLPSARVGAVEGVEWYLDTAAAPRAP